MIELDGTHFFGMKEEISQDNRYVAYHITADPEDFDLKRVSKVPICTIVMNTSDDIFHNDGSLSLSNDKKQRLAKINGRSSVIYNMYIHDEYYTFRDSFSSKSKFPSTIVYVTSKDLGKNNDHAVLVAAIPIHGMLAPVTKSRNYEIYSGKFIHCKPFQYRNLSNITIYNGIAYIYARLYSYIQIDQYERGKSEEDGQIHIIQYFPLDSYLYGKNEYTQVFRIHEDNKFLLEKPKRNLFHLSDVPAGVMEKNNTIRTMMKS